MNRRVTTMLLLFTVAIIVGVPGALATQGFLNAFQQLYTDGSCSTCHINGVPGGPRTDYGLMFENQPNHDNDPISALRAIGPAPGTSPLTTAAPTATRTPERTPRVTETPRVTGTPAPVPVPEFPTVVLPVAAVMGLVMLLLYRRK